MSRPPLTPENFAASVQQEDDKSILLDLIHQQTVKEIQAAEDKQALDLLGQVDTKQTSSLHSPKRFPALDDWLIGTNPRNHALWTGSYPKGTSIPCISREQVLQEHLPLVKKDMWHAIRQAMSFASKQGATKETFEGLAATLWDILNNVRARLDGEIQFSSNFTTSATGFGQVEWAFSVTVEGPLASFWCSLDANGDTPLSSTRQPSDRVESLSLTLNESLFVRSRREPRDDWDDWLFDPEDA